MTRALFHAVPDDDVPDYPIPSDARLNNWFLRFETRRWLGSAMRLTADPEVGYAYLNLIFISSDQAPMGTLPRDPRQLARLLTMPADQFEGLLRRQPSPLQHWVPCRTDRGEVRLMHPFVRDTLLEQIADREARAGRASADAARKRLDRLREAMARAGFTKAVIADQVLVERIDGWLNDNHKGNRTQEAYNAAFLHAVQRKWFAPAGATS